MTRLEKYKNVLIPIDDIAYAEFRPKQGDWQADFYYGTFVRIRTNQTGILQTVQISTKNVLDDFSKWLKQFERRESAERHNCPFADCPNGGTQTHQYGYVTTEAPSTDLDPKTPYCITYANEDKPKTMVCHDGIEHPL